MRGERHGRGRPQLLGDVGPRCIEHLVDRARAAVERREQPPLAVESVRDVLVELRGRIIDRWSVAGAQKPQRPPPQPCEPIQVASERARVRSDEHASLAEHRVAGERDVAADEREVVGRVTGREHGLQWTEPLSLAEHDVDGTAPGGDRDARQARPKARDARAVIGMIVRQRDAAEPSATFRTSTISVSMWSGRSGPGSITHAGARETIHEFVPVNVNGPGLSARTPTASIPSSSISVTA